MRKTAAFVLFLTMIIYMLAGCGKSGTKKDGTLSIVATIFPEYDWVQNIVGKDSDNVDITLLLDNGVDLHSFQPTAGDIIKISECDMFIYVGGESDKWVDDALKEASNGDMVVIKLLDVLGESVKEEEAVEGMEADEDENGDENDEEKEYDEHVWLSLKNAALICDHISKALCRLDGANSSKYEANAKNYIAALNGLDVKYADAIKSADTKTLVFGDRFPFRYLTDDYGLTYYAAFMGCSAETEASFKTIIFLAEKTDELGLKAIMRIETSDGSVANAVKEATSKADQKILVLDSLQSTTSRNANGKTYISAMESNLEVLKEALSTK